MNSDKLIPPGVYYPERISRRGEVIAWASTLITVIGWAILVNMGAPVFFGLKVLCVVLGLSSLAITLGNWMDRQTRLELTPDHVHFENGVRRVSLQWSEIERIEVVPSAWGNKISVLGKKVHFDFRSLGEVKVRGEIKGRIGFEKGDDILKYILLQAKLKPATGQRNEISYYSKG